MDAFLQDALDSKVPKEFYLAVQNYGRVIIPVVPGTKAYGRTRGIVKHLLGVDCHTEEEAMHILGWANTVSLVKQSEEASSPEEYKRIKQEAEEMFGMTTRITATIANPHGLKKLVPGFGNRYRTSTLKRLTTLRGQAERNMEDGQLKSRISLLAA